MAMESPEAMLEAAKRIVYMLAPKAIIEASWTATTTTPKTLTALNPPPFRAQEAGKRLKG
jgi:hypothetical protein